jgi:hypothetical protein
MVRGLKEDGSLIPVAFMDMQCYVNVVKEIRGTGLCILGDALKGLWFTGYSVITPKFPVGVTESSIVCILSSQLPLALGLISHWYYYC